MYGKSKQRRKRFLFPEQNLSYMIQYTVLYGISEHYVCTICTERKQKQKQKQRNLFMFKQLAGYSNRQYNRTMDIAHHHHHRSANEKQTKSPKAKSVVLMITHYHILKSTQPSRTNGTAWISELSKLFSLRITINSSLAAAMFHLSDQILFIRGSAKMQWYLLFM